MGIFQAPVSLLQLLTLGIVQDALQKQFFALVAMLPFLHGMMSLEFCFWNIHFQMIIEVYN